MLNVQKYLLTNTLDDLKETYGVKNTICDSIVGLNYDQIEAKPGCNIANECRGLIIMKEDASSIVSNETFGMSKLVAYPFNRFYNYGDSNASCVDIEDESTVYFNKLDGTFCILYYHPIKEEWHVSTRSVPMADKQITGWEEFTFRKLFEKALAETLFSNGMIDKDSKQELVFNQWTKSLEKDFTYCFELTTPLNRVVVEYKDYRVHLLGIRNLNNNLEVPVCEMYHKNKFHGVPVCPAFKISNLEEAIKYINTIPAVELEGVVVCDKNFNRMKIKSLEYVAYNKIRDSAVKSPRALMELILLEKLDDLLPLFDDFLKGKAEETQEKLRILIHKVDSTYHECMEAATGADNPRKAFALAVQEKKGWMAPLMDRFTGKNDGLVDYIQKKKDPKTLGWQDGFLDSILEQIK